MNLGVCRYTLENEQNGTIFSRRTAQSTCLMPLIDLNYGERLLKGVSLFYLRVYVMADFLKTHQLKHLSSRLCEGIDMSSSLKPDI